MPFGTVAVGSEVPARGHSLAQLWWWWPSDLRSLLSAQGFNEDLKKLFGLQKQEWSRGFAAPHCLPGLCRSPLPGGPCPSPGARTAWPVTLPMADDRHCQRTLTR